MAVVMLGDFPAGHVTHLTPPPFAVALRMIFSTINRAWGDDWSPALSSTRFEPVCNGTVVWPDSVLQLVFRTFRPSVSTWNDPVWQLQEVLFFVIITNSPPSGLTTWITNLSSEYTPTPVWTPLSRLLPDRRNPSFSKHSEPWQRDELRENVGVLGHEANDEISSTGYGTAFAGQKGQLLLVLSLYVPGGQGWHCSLLSLYSIPAPQECTHVSDRFAGRFTPKPDAPDPPTWHSSWSSGSG